MNSPPAVPGDGIKNVLLATDFSEPSLAAARVALAQAHRWGAVLHLLFVRPDRGDSAHPGLEALAKEASASVRVETAILDGSPADQILAYASAHAIDLIVMGTHGRSGFSRVLLGSVAERVTRMAKCPVLTVPGQMVHPIEPAEEPEPELGRCVVCGAKGPDLICLPCRQRLRAEAILKKF